MKMKCYYLTILVLFCNLTNLQVSAQSIVEEVANPTLVSESVELKNLPTETIEKISASKKIFILSHKNNAFDKGDFVTLVLNQNFAARALVAKITDKNAGIKILKIYSLSQWKKLGEGVEVQILRGDDSRFFSATQNEKSSPESANLIHSEDDLYNEENMLEDKLTIDENKNRLIKTDNIVTLNLGYIAGLNADGDSQRYQQLNLAWAYQIEDNIWAEASYGRNIVQNFPAEDTETVVNNFIVRAKYIFNAPLQSYIMPYLGFQMLSASSPDAGVPDNKKTPTDLDFERKLVSDLNKKKVIFGATALKRLVPGWFFRVDLGTDLLAGGFGLEF